MNIEDVGELRSFETIPSEITFYMSAVRYHNYYWVAGPYDTDKAKVIRMLHTWGGVEAARIYAVKLPTKLMPGA